MYFLFYYYNFFSFPSDGVLQYTQTFSLILLYCWDSYFVCNLMAFDCQEIKGLLTYFT